MSLASVGSLVEMGVGMLTLVGLLWAGWRYVMPFLRAIAVGLIATAKLPEMQASIASIRHEVLENGGGSLKDQVRMTRQSQSRTETNIERMVNVSRIKADAERDANFETDGDGLCVWANRSYLHWTGRGLNEVLGWGWINVVAPEDRDRIREEWSMAVEENRAFNAQYSMRGPDNRPFRVECTAKPVFAGGKIESWYGIIHKLQEAA